MEQTVPAPPPNDGDLVVDHHHGDDAAMRVWVAAQEGRTEDLQGLLRTLQESESTSVINTAKALCVAARNDHVGAVRVLLAATADANEGYRSGGYQFRSGMPPTCVAAREGHCDVIEALVRAKADVDTAEQSGATPLNAAILRGHADVVQLLAVNAGGQYLSEDVHKAKRAR